MANADRFTVKAGEAIQSAARLAGEAGHPEIGGVHLLSSLITQEGGIVAPVLEKAGIRIPLLRDRVTDALATYGRVEGGAEPSISRDLRKALERAEKEARDLGDQYVSAEHLLLGLVEQKDDSARVLKESGVTRDLILTALEQIRGSHRVTDQNPEEKYQALQRYSRDLTELAREGKLDPVIGRDEEIRRVIKVLGRRTKNNPVLIGEPGVGKTAIVEGLAQRIIEGDIPSSLANKRLVALDISAMLAGAKYRGEFEDRMKYITSIPIADYDQAVRFYTEVLGFKKKRDEVLGEGVRFITVVSPEDPDGPEILLEPNVEYPAMKAFREALNEDGIPITSFAVDDVQQEYERLQKQGVQFTQKPLSQGGWTTAVFDDTNGNLIEIAEVPEGPGNE